MRVFVTGATGLVGSAVVRELLDAGHQVLGLARSDESAATLTAAGAEVRRGSLEDLDSLRAGAEAADGVIHTAFLHDFTDLAKGVRVDRTAIETFGEMLAGSDRPLVITSGTGLVASTDGPSTEETVTDSGSFAAVRLANENVAIGLAERGVRASVVRLPPSVHGEADKHGFVPILIGVAREKGVAGYVGDGTNRWPAVHQLDAAHLYRLAVEKAAPGTRLHAVGDEGVPTREIAEAIGRQLNVPTVSVPPERAADHFGFLGGYFALDLRSTSALTRTWLGWQATQPGLIEDLDKGHYFTV